MKAQSRYTRFCRKKTYIMLPDLPVSTLHNIAQRKNNFAREYNLQCYLDQCGPTLHKDFTYAMLGHISKQTPFLSKITYKMLCLSGYDNIA